MAEAPVGTKTVFIDVGKGPEAFTVVTDTPEDNLIPSVLPELHTVKILEVLPRVRSVDRTLLKRTAESRYGQPPSEPAQAATGPVIDLTTTEEQESCIQIEHIKCPETESPQYIPESNFKKHEIIHCTDNTLHFKECPFVGQSKAHLNNHMIDNQADDAPGIPSKEFVCKFCNFKTRMQQNLYSHNSYHHKLYKCKNNNCAFSTTEESKYNDHVKDCTPPLRCTECPFVGKTTTNLNTHLRDEHALDEPTEEFVCKVCDFKTRIRKKWHAHNWYHHKLYKCKTKKCQFRTTRQSKYNEHVKNCSEEMLHRNSEFRCGICSWSSKHHVRILLHLIHHPNQEVDESVVDISVLRKHGIR